MAHFRRMQKKENIKAYASSLAHEAFEGVTRKTGLPYTHEHLAQVARDIEYVLLPSKYKDAAVGAGWLHDIVEDIPAVDVYNPFENNQIHRKGIIYLNDLLRAAEDLGEYLCYIDNLMTHREDTSYADYVHNIFLFPDSKLERNLGILAAVLKMVDRRLNIDPNEHRNVNRLVEEYMRMKDKSQQELEGFYKKTKTIDAFRRKGEVDINIALFVETLTETFEAKQQATALDNLSLYLPLAEQRLIVDIGENNLFHCGKLRRMLKDLYIDSLRLCPITGDSKVQVIKKLGVNRNAPEIPSYTRILKEIREDIARGVYKV